MKSSCMWETGMITLLNAAACFYAPNNHACCMHKRRCALAKWADQE